MRNRKTLIAAAAMVMLMGGVPAASAATTPSTAKGAAPAWAAFDLALPAATLTSVRLNVRQNGDRWTLTVEWNISYSAANIANQPIYWTFAYIMEQDDVDDDVVASGVRKSVEVKPRAQGHNFTQEFTLNSEALHTEIGDEEIYASAFAKNIRTGREIQLNTRRHIFDV
ncbi:hypothetical protein [Streptomyces sp. PSKA30]|uniref:hypothetical protein n=1 Tax=Streptomyces sp. PSKA30 TaxID=2874597 RepID=UPI001CD06ECA|nr:hypothetical protein [Streptomyces sp. PSKA30]MBZ9642322.1 hypothetical protein [Streptomyces sp. PSKA30]